MPDSAPAVSAAVQLAEASAATARLGYQLTTEALDESTAAAVFPLLALELGAIAESYVAYIAVDLAWEAAQVSAGIALQAAAARPFSPA